MYVLNIGDHWITTSNNLSVSRTTFSSSTVNTAAKHGHLRVQ